MGGITEWTLSFLAGNAEVLGLTLALTVKG